MKDVMIVAATALLWSFLWGAATAWNLLVGAVLGMLLLSVMQRTAGRSFGSRAFALVRFVVRFAYELLVSNVMVALLAFRPRPRFHPHVIGVPLRVESDAAITLLSLTITLLPGTVAMGVSDDRRTLYAHAIAEADPDRSRAGVQRIESLILGFMS